MDGSYDRTGNKPNYGTWSDVPTFERNSINALIDQWEGLIGFTVNVPDNIKADMASYSITSLFQTGQYMWSHVYDFIDPAAINHSIWAKFGLTYDDMYSQQNSYTQTMMQLTGQGGSWDDFAAKLHDQQGRINFGLLSEQIKQDPTMQKTYGWLKYGMDYDQFQAQKVQQQQLLGHDISNEEAVTQLQYMHAGTSAGQSVSQSPTLTQVEKRQAQTGLGQSVVR